MNLILMGRNATRLKEVALILKSDVNSDLRIEILEVDFSRIQDYSQAIYEMVQNKDIGILVNNVGVILQFPMFFNEVKYLK